MVCGGKVVIDERSRYVLPSNLAAAAHCQICDTRYLAVIEAGHEMGERIYDLAYLSTKSETPGAEDVLNEVRISRAENVQSISKIVLPHGGEGKMVIIQTIKIIDVIPRHSSTTE